eukprot:4962883-Amphidinium_carterae.1
MYPLQSVMRLDKAVVGTFVRIRFETTGNTNKKSNSKDDDDADDDADADDDDDDDDDDIGRSGSQATASDCLWRLFVVVIQ